MKSKESLESYNTVPSFDSLKASNVSISKLSDENYRKNVTSSIGYNKEELVRKESEESQLPHISLKLTDQKVEINGTCIFMIEFNANDENYQINWLHNNKILRQNNRNEKICIKNETNKSYLRIINVQIEDSGVYECAIQTKHGIVKSMGKLSIIYGKNK